MTTIEQPVTEEVPPRAKGGAAPLRPHVTLDGFGFVPYTDLAKPQVRRLSEVIDALAEPLSQAPARALSG